MNDPGLFSGLLLSVLLVMIGGLVLSVTQNHRSTLAFQVQLFCYAFALRFAMSIVIYQFGFVQVLGDEDSSGWWAGAILQRRWEQQGVGLLDLPLVLVDVYTGPHRGYSYMLGILFYLTGAPARLPAAALNCFIGALTVVFTYRIASSLFSPWVAVRVGWWTCFFPSLIIWSAQTLKEPTVILLELIALYCCVRMKLTGFSSRHVFLCALTILCLIPFRFYAAYITAVAIFIALLWPHVSRGKTTIASALGLLVLLVPILVVSGTLAQDEAQFEQFDLRRVQLFRRNIAMGSGSGVRTDYDLQTPQGLGLATAVGAAHLLLAPFPWQLRGGSLRMVFTMPELVVWWWLVFVGLLPGLWYTIRHRFNDIQAALIFLLGLGFLYSLMFGNVGLVFRQRAQLLPWLLMFAVVGLEQRALRRLTVSKTPTSIQILAKAKW